MYWLPLLISLAASPTAPPSVEDLDDPTARVEEVRRLYDNLELEAVPPLTEALMEHPALTLAERVEILWLRGAALAVLDNPVDAAVAFRMLLRSEPDFRPPEGASPKTTAVFAQVQKEEREMAERLAALERARIIGSLDLQEKLPDNPVGGYPLPMVYRLRDPGRAVQSVRVMYRRGDEGDFSALALEPNEYGEWRGELPGEWTENAGGLRMEYYVATFDPEGEPLLTLGKPGSVRELYIEAGTVADATPLYESPWFWVTVVGSAVAVGVAGGVAYDQATKIPSGDLSNIGLSGR